MSTAKPRQTCNKCLGTGSTYTYRDTPNGQRMTEHNCSRCGGRGDVPAGTRNPHNPTPKPAARPTKRNGPAAPAKARAPAPKAAAKPVYAVGDRVAVTVKGKRTPGTVRALWKTQPEYGRQIGDLLVETRPGGGAAWYSPSQASHLKGGAGKGASTVRTPTMADVKARNREYHQKQGHAFHYFNKANRRMFGPESYHGPYAGPGGLYFVLSNQGGVHVKKVQSSGDIDHVPHPHSVVGLDAVRAFARSKAAGQ